MGPAVVAGCWQEGPGRGKEDGPKPTLVPTAAPQPTVPFKVHEFMQWAPSEIIKALGNVAALHQPLLL